jgi:hypothetical protein
LELAGESKKRLSKMAREMATGRNHSLPSLLFDNIFSLVSHGKKAANDVEMLGLLSDAGVKIYHTEKLHLSPGVRWRQRQRSYVDGTEFG